MSRRERAERRRTGSRVDESVIGGYEQWSRRVDATPAQVLREQEAFCPRVAALEGALARRAAVASAAWP